MEPTQLLFGEGGLDPEQVTSLLQGPLTQTYAHLGAFNRNTR